MTTRCPRCGNEFAGAPAAGAARCPACGAEFDPARARTETDIPALSPSLMEEIEEVRPGVPAEVRTFRLR
jgi:uncharacterized protein (UPF0212 family)